MVVVGLTGGIASGKSTVTAMFAALGAISLSADADARAVLSAGSPVFNSVREAFPSAISTDGGVDRSALASIIFSSVDARQRLEVIMHPAIEARMRDAIHAARTQRATGVLVYEVPLLFEANLEALFDLTIAIVTLDETQRRRLQARESAIGRPPLSAADLADRLGAQFSSEIKAKRADYIIYNDGLLDATRHQVDAIWTAISTGIEPAPQPSHA